MTELLTTRAYTCQHVHFFSRTCGQEERRCSACCTLALGASPAPPPPRDCAQPLGVRTRQGMRKGEVTGGLKGGKGGWEKEDELGSGWECLRKGARDGTRLWNRRRITVVRGAIWPPRSRPKITPVSKLTPPIRSGVDTVYWYRDQYSTCRNNSRSPVQRYDTLTCPQILEGETHTREPIPVLYKPKDTSSLLLVLPPA